jgi:hypothetical protein
VDEFPIDGLPSQTQQTLVTFTPFGTPVTPDEVRGRLSQNLYAQLADSSNAETADATVARAIDRAEIYIGTILKYLGAAFNLDSGTVREIVLMQTLYELHLALGHGEVGKEYRMQAKNTIIAAFGSFPDTDSAAQSAPKAALAAVAAPPRQTHDYGRAFSHM